MLPRMLRKKSSKGGNRVITREKGIATKAVEGKAKELERPNHWTRRGPQSWRLSYGKWSSD